MNSKELALSIAKFLDSEKGDRPGGHPDRRADHHGDYFVVATASNTTLVKSLCEDLDEYLGRQGIEPKRIEGRSSAQWILMDCAMSSCIFSMPDPQFFSMSPVLLGRCPRLPLELEGEKNKLE